MAARMGALQVSVVEPVGEATELCFTTGRPSGPVAFRLRLRPPSCSGKLFDRSCELKPRGETCESLDCRQVGPRGVDFQNLGVVKD